MTTILTDDPVAYQYLVRQAASLESLVGSPVLPTIELVVDLTDVARETAPAPDVTVHDSDDGADEVSVVGYVPAYVTGATVTHAVQLRPNLQRRRADKYTVCDRGRTRIVTRPLYDAELSTVSCGQCRKRLINAGALANPAA